MKIKESELILNSDGSIYHLALLPEQLAKNVVLVGDPQRVPMVSKHLDKIDHVVERREFLTHTGTKNGIGVSIISTGIGTDNIDIVFNELDALVNIDFNTRTIKEEKTILNLIRIGTSGAIQSDIPVDSYLVSQFALGLEGLMHYYNFKNNADETLLFHALISNQAVNFPIRPYLFSADELLLKTLASDYKKGITATCSGFYGPQMRTLRLTPSRATLLDELAAFNYKDLQVTNLEMETSGIYGLAKVLGHRGISFNAILANRATGEFSSQPKVTVERLIEEVLSRFENLPA